MEKERNNGIDFAKILSMYMIVFLHFCLYGGAFERTGEIQCSEAIVQLFYIFCYCAVNVYAIITGYLMSDAEEIKLGRIIELWFQVAFFSIIVSVSHAFLTCSFNYKEIFFAFLPVLTRRWWYISSYFGIFLFIPYFNKLIKNMTRPEYRKLLVLMCLVFSIGSTISSAVGIDTFNLATGCSPVWLMMMYFLGGYNRKYGKTNSNRHHLIKYIACGLILFLIWVVTVIGTTAVFGEVKLGKLFVTYTSPFVIYMAYELFQFCLTLNISNCKIIQKISECTLGVYLISEHPVIREMFVANSMVNFLNASGIIRVGVLLVATTTMFLAALFLSKVQNLLFRVLKIREIANQIGKCLNRFMEFEGK